MNSEQLVNDIKKLDIKQQNIECKLRELRIFYITNKKKYDYDYKLIKIFFDGTILEYTSSKINKYEKKLTELSKCEKLEIEKNSIISNELTALIDDVYSKIYKYEKKLTEYGRRIGLFL